MKKIILSFAFASLLISCKEETKEKLEDAKQLLVQKLKKALILLKLKPKKN